MRVLVTGATGFIGFHTAARLRAEGHEVRALVRSAEKGRRVLDPIGVAPADRVVGDMADAGAVARALEGCDALVHAAASVTVTRGARDFDANLRGTETVVGAGCERGLQIVYVSSLLAILDWLQSRTRYGLSKTRCDAWVRARHAEGAPVALLYPPGVVGPDDPGLSESVRAYRSFLRGTLRSEGGNQMLDARDLALLATRLLESRSRGPVVAAGHFFDWDEFTALLERVTGARIRRIAAPGWLLRAAARGMDAAGRITGRSMPMTGEGVEIATRFRRVPDSPRVAELGVRWRDPAETLADLFRWLVSAGRLPPHAVPSLADGGPC